MDRQTIREKFFGRWLGSVGLGLVAVNVLLLLICVGLGSYGIDVHVTSRNRVVVSANLSRIFLGFSLLMPGAVGIAGLLFDKRRSAAVWALVGCVVVFVLYGVCR